MHVEDHPFDYREFEGIIPEGKYGAGRSSCGTRGRTRSPKATDPAKEIANGKIKFVLHGKKLHGEFTLVKIKPREGESGDPWLLIKDRDEYVDPKYDPADHPESRQERQDARGHRRRSHCADVAIETSRARDRAAPARDASSAIRCRRSKAPMLATLVDEPFDDPEWLFEIKWDGYRALCTIEPTARSR